MSLCRTNILKYGSVTTGISHKVVKTGISCNEVHTQVVFLQHLDGIIKLKTPTAKPFPSMPSTRADCRKGLGCMHTLQKIETKINFPNAYTKPRHP